MEKLYVVRGVDWKRVGSEGVPLDFIDVMVYFNRMLERDACPLLPRSEPITYTEIHERWVPGAGTNIIYLAVNRKPERVICSGTLFVDGVNKIGELSIAKDLDYTVGGVGTDVTHAIIDEAISKGITVSIHTSVENVAMIRVMEKLVHGHTRLISDYEKYRGKIRANIFDVYEWVIRPNSLP